MQRLQVSFLARAAVGRSVPAHAVDSHSPLHTCTVAGAAHLAAMQPSTPLTCICVRAGPGCCRRRAKGMLRVGGHVRAARRPQVRAASVLLHVAAPSMHPYSGAECAAKAQGDALRLPCGRGGSAEHPINHVPSPAGSSGAGALGHGRWTAAKWADPSCL